MSSLNYNPLHQHTTYSALDGCAKPKDLARRCVEVGHSACACTDHGTVLGHFAFWHAMQDAGVKPILGVEAYHVEDVALYADTGKADGDRRTGEKEAMRFAHLTLLARTPAGYQNLLALVSHSYRHFYKKPIIDDALLFEHQAGLTVLSGCVIGRLSQLINLGREEDAFQLLTLYANRLESFFVELVPCPGLDLSERALPVLYRMAEKLGLPMVATDDAHFCVPEEFLVQDTLLCANTGQRVFDKERTIQLPDMHWRCDGAEVFHRLRACLPDAPDAELARMIERSTEISDACEAFPLPRAGSPVYHVGQYWTPEEKLRLEAQSGLLVKFTGRNCPKEYTERLTRELDTLIRCELANYVLVVWDLVREMRRRDILVVPRGSAGGSLVLWALDVTVVDPIAHELPFERFCDESKRDLDVDLDFEHLRRHEAFEYLKEKYGDENCAHVANVVTFGARQALQDGGKALQLPDWAMHAMARLIPEGEEADAGLHDTEVLVRLLNTNETAKKVLARCNAMSIIAALEGHVKTASIHAGGFLVSSVPIQSFTAVMQRPTRVKGRVVGWGERVASLTKDEAAALGALKIDCLGSKTLTAIRETLDALGKPLSWLYALPIEDPTVFQMLGEGRNLGLFQLQGTAAGNIMRKLKPETFDEFVAVSALARPGPLQSGSVDHFIDRKRGVVPIPDLHETFRCLVPTYGIVVYQEQAMALAAAAGFEIAEVQKIRKIVSKIGGADALEPYKARLCEGWFERGAPIEQIIEVWGQLQKAANYTFCQAHAVQYGYVGMWTGHLKVLAPDRFTAGLCRHVGGKDPDDRIFSLLREFGERGGRVALIDPVQSRASFTASGTMEVVGGYQSLKNCGEAMAKAAIDQGPFGSWEELLAVLGRRVALPLAASGATDGRLDPDVLQSLAPWYPLRPLTPEEEAVRDAETVPIAVIRQAVAEGWREDVTIIGRITRRVAIDLIAQAKKYGSEPPAPGDPTTKLRMILTDETGSIDLGFSAKVWAAHARAGLLDGAGAGLGNTIRVRAWWSEEWQRFFVRSARILKLWSPFVAPEKEKPARKPRAKKAQVIAACEVFEGEGDAE